jgi:CO/xanthine dehydrogenase FAD-binding subunit
MDLVEVTGARAARTRSDLGLGPGEALLSGGTWLFSEPQPGVTGLVDLTTMGWAPSEQRPGCLRIAATCTIHDLVELPSGLLGSARDMVRHCAEALLMSFKVQHVATVGGNVCLALPAGAMVAAGSALEADAVVWGPAGLERREPVARFVRGPRLTSLVQGEVLRALDIPLDRLADRYAVRRIGLTPHGRSSSLVVGRAEAGGALTLTVTAATTRPVQLRFDGTPGADALAAELARIDCWHTDAHGSAPWRRAMTARLAAEVCDELR